MHLQQNQGVLRGTLKENIEFEYERDGEVFYKGTLQVKRDSGTIDEIPLSIPEKILDSDYFNNPVITVYGSFRSRNQLINGKSTLQLNFFVDSINNDEVENPNQIFLEGFLCKDPNYRLTPLNREITDLLLAVNRNNGRSDYLPCIAWGRNASWLKQQSKGIKVQIYGRIQSRKFTKTGDIEPNTRTAYEISISRISKISN